MQINRPESSSIKHHRHHHSLSLISQRCPCRQLSGGSTCKHSQHTAYAATLPELALFFQADREQRRPLAKKATSPAARWADRLGELVQSGPVQFRPQLSIRLAGQKCSFSTRRTLARYRVGARFPQPTSSARVISTRFLASSRLAESRSLDMSTATMKKVLPS